jgi:Fur family transcriptional regulator, ferric uptake regulator
MLLQHLPEALIETSIVVQPLPGMRKAINKFDAETVLSRHHLKKTAARLRVLSMIARKDIAISLPALARKMKDARKSTLYGVLNSLEAKGIIYKIFGLNGEAHYAMCPPANPHGTQPLVYLHFSCAECKKIYRINEVPCPAPLLPQGFAADRFTMCFSGTCPDCDRKMNYPPK